MDQGWQRTKRTTPLKTKELIEEAKPALARVGRVLQTRPHPKALPTSRRLGPAAHLVASLQVLAQCWLEKAACAVARLSERCNLSDSTAALGLVAEEEGFEPPRPFRV